MIFRNHYHKDSQTVKGEILVDGKLCLVVDIFLFHHWLDIVSVILLYVHFIFKRVPITLSVWFGDMSRPVIIKLIK